MAEGPHNIARSLEDCSSRLTKIEEQSATVMLLLKEVFRRLSVIEEKLEMNVSMCPTDPHGGEETPCAHNLAGEDDDIKIIATVDSSISKVLKGHNDSVIGPTLDLKNEFLASIDGFETIKYWKFSSKKLVHTLKSIALNWDSNASLLNLLSWSPDKEILIVPDLKNVIVMNDRDIAIKIFTLKEDHEKLVC